MKRLNWFQNWIARVVGLTHFDFNQAQKDNWRQAMELGIEKGRQEKPDCLLCPLYKAAHPHEIAAFEPPEPTTDGKIAAEQVNLPNWFKRRNPHLVTTKLMPKIPRYHKMTLLSPNDDFLL